MCESAQVTPSLATSFIHVFADRGASGVLGTECAMRPRVALYVGNEFLNGLLTGAEAGEVLRQLRKHLITKRNLLGLAYTFFGGAGTRFKFVVGRTHR
jgi:hypothetical protein